MNTSYNNVATNDLFASIMAKRLTSQKANQEISARKQAYNNLFYKAGFTNIEAEAFLAERRHWFDAV